MLTTLFIITAANAIVGGLIGICGIAGFLLPMLYADALSYSIDQALAFSFLAFLVSGIFGSWNYYRAGNLDVPTSVKMGVGSLIGAATGVALQALISQESAKIILYIVVLVSGLSILGRMYAERRKATAAQQPEAQKKALVSKAWFLFLFGFATSVICSLSGAGGPVLVMPLLVSLGISARLAVGIALFDSVFIAIPACLGYLARIDLSQSLLLLLVIACSHGAGVLYGSRLAGRVPVTGLKLFVAIFSVCIAIYMLL